MFNLKPYEPIALTVDLKAKLSRQDQTLQIEFSLQDPRGVVIDSMVTGHWTTWSRADELWKTTCFEAFFGVPGKAGYWELNLSPSRQQWNLYSFDSYRKPQPPRVSGDFELTAIEIADGKMKATLTAQKAIPELECNACAVLRVDNGVVYFAVQHSKVKPDFHDRSTFSLKI